MRWTPSTLAGRLLLTACLFLTVALVLAGVIISVILHHVVTDQVDQRLQAQATSLASALRVQTDGSIAVAPGLDAPPFDRRGSGWYWQIEGAGSVLLSRSLGDGSLSVPPQPFEWRRLLSGRSPAVEGRDTNGRSLHIVSLAASIADRPVTISVSAPGTAISDPLKRALFWLIPSVGILGLVLIAATLLQIRWGLRPLSSLRGSLERVRTGEQDRVPDDQPAELKPVVAELNALIAENEERLASARLNLANMAHSLKTPLASLSLAVREPDRDSTDTLGNLVDQLETRIRHHLGRARADTGAGHRRYRTDVVAHLVDLTSAMEKIYNGRDIRLALTIEPGLMVACEEQDFDELIGNVIDNAFKWAKSRVAVTATKAFGRIVIVIEDDGPGIPDHALEQVLRPGQRLDETIPGHGFGLSVSQDLVSLYGGSLDLAPAAMTGVKATIELPSLSESQTL